MFITSKNPSANKYVIKVLKETYNTITVNEGRVHSYLGMTFDFSEAGKTKISMDGYIEDIITSYQVTKSASTPANSKLFEIFESSPLLDEDKAMEFHSRVAKLLYLAKRARPDILLAISFLTTRIMSPTEQDYSKLDRILHYLNSSKDLFLTLNVDKECGVKVFAYIDASHGIHPNFKGHTGGVITIGSGTIHAKSSKHAEDQL